jgi:hypothetical protein
MNAIGHCAVPSAAGQDAERVLPAQVTVGKASWTDANVPDALGTCYITSECNGGVTEVGVSRHQCCHQMMPIYHTNGTSWRSNGSQICSPCATRIGAPTIRRKKT